MHKTYWKLKTLKTLGVLPSNEKSSPSFWAEGGFDYAHALKHIDARSGGESGGYRGKHRNKDVEDFTPKGFVFHIFFSW